jgi:hypothetical protein
MAAICITCDRRFVGAPGFGAPDVRDQFERGCIPKACRDDRVFDFGNSHAARVHILQQVCLAEESVGKGIVWMNLECFAASHHRLIRLAQHQP